MSWKKWIVALSTVVFSTQFSPASAGNYYNCDTGSDCGFSFCDSDPCEGWSIYADYLYWRPRRCDLNYAFTTLDTENENLAFVTGLSGICPSYDSGFRIGILKAFGDLDFGVHYTWFRSKDGSSINNVGEDFIIGQTKVISPFVTDPIELAASDYKVELNQIDAELGYHLELSDCLAARIFSGFRYAKIKQSQNSVYSSDINDQYANSNPLAQVDVIQQKADLDFYGLYVGNKASYKICDCFDFFGGLSLGIGVGDVSQRIDQQGKADGGPDVEFAQGDLVSTSCWKSIAVLDLNVGITFPLCNVCCTDLAFSVGYEFHQWFNVSDFIAFPFGNYGVDSHCCDLSFDGLFVRVSAAF
ncbi:MOMP-like family protein [Waddlia chondrophila 2032/99]|uniref:MOMP-like family protein n=2 Tax=Waddlia chondrophila TaxID=71667 RepID=F8LBK1_9BACT|nr:Lpg1974 family pore-forming outer membrane protein [Waddlia chondrophila]ADI37441.1 putative membrane protein [Waddlia chondrophila WSU 86-1044]CCB90865.1 MOMP-like family protein [Waddlia chondrophila 2032/99]